MLSSMTIIITRLEDGWEIVMASLLKEAISLEDRVRNAHDAAMTMVEVKVKSEKLSY